MDIEEIASTMSFLRCYSLGRHDGIRTWKSLAAYKGIDLGPSRQS
jgi:hypothetical protein